MVNISLPPTAPTGSHPGNALPENPIIGTSVGGPGVSGQANRGVGVYGQSLGFIPPTGPGQAGVSIPAGDAVLGEGLTGVHGVSTGVGFGVRGDSPQGFAAVHGNGGKRRMVSGVIPSAQATPASSVQMTAAATV
jgi:hypothetical protein